MMNYQIPDIQERLEEIILGTDGQLQGIYAEEPMLVLSLAEKFNFPKIGEMVMNHVVKAHRDRVFTTKYSLTSLTVMQIMELLTERGRMLSSRFFRFMEDKIEGIQYLTDYLVIFQVFAPTVKSILQAVKIKTIITGRFI
jgi:hypothetical protein